MPDKKPPRDFRLTGQIIGEKTCSCGQRIRFVRTPKGGSMPIDPDTGHAHWINCPDRDRYRKPKPEVGKTMERKWAR